MGIHAWIVVGLVAGWLAGEATRGRGFGLAGDLIVGVLGAMLGGFLASATFLQMPNAVNEINIMSIFAAFVGAAILVWILRLVSPGSCRVY
jgi:uncharacterized membrane protein YeaQ/YmgE (transglycosylase-associated protein family)